MRGLWLASALSTNTALAMRAEYEYFSLADAHPNIVSLGVTWTFF
jgi:hypothetical protein